MPSIMKISPQGRIRIPKKIMNILGIEKGDYVEITVEKNANCLKTQKTY